MGMTVKSDKIITAAEAAKIVDQHLANIEAKTANWVLCEMIALSAEIKLFANRGIESIDKTYRKVISDQEESPPDQILKLCHALEDNGYTIKWSETGKQINRDNTETRIYKVTISW